MTHALNWTEMNRSKNSKLLFKTQPDPTWLRKQEEYSATKTISKIINVSMKPKTELPTTKISGNNTPPHTHTYSSQRVNCCEVPKALFLDPSLCLTIAMIARKFLSKVLWITILNLYFSTQPDPTLYHSDRSHLSPWFPLQSSIPFSHNILATFNLSFFFCSPIHNTIFLK